MKAYCDQFANVIHIAKEFIINNGINSINLETVDKELGIKLDPHIIQEKSKTIEITYPPTKNLKSSTIRITYFREDNNILSSEIIGGQGGGGRKDFAHAGGQDQTKINEAFEKVKSLILFLFKILIYYV